MAVNWTKEIVAIGVGAVDRYAQDMDKNTTPPRTEPFKTASDWVRIAGAIGGLAVQSFWPRYDDVGEALSLSGAPLLTQTVWKAVAQQTGETTSRRVTYTPNRARRSPAATRAQRYPAETHQEQFKNTNRLV